ncbi:hypothetical protein ACWEV3_08185 [Saccharopolyspora sp. NPDC003752]
MYRGKGVETATLVGISETVEISSYSCVISDEVSLIFRGNDELVLSCTRRGFAALRTAVDAADRDLV